MRVALNMSKAVYDYFSSYDLSSIADTLLEMYDFTDLPPTSGQRDVERVVDINNEFYIELYNKVGPRSKKVSLGRLFEFAYNMDVLSLPRFEIFKTTPHSPVPALLMKAYRAMLDVQKYDKNAIFKEITDIIYTCVKEAQNGTRE
jgi:hypothetical protein